MCDGDQPIARTRVIDEKVIAGAISRRAPTNDGPEMPREETDNDERLDYAAPKADVRAINNHCKACLFSRYYLETHETMRQSTPESVSSPALRFSAIRRSRRTTALTSRYRKRLHNPL